MHAYKWNMTRVKYAAIYALIRIWIMSLYCALQLIAYAYISKIAWQNFDSKNELNSNFT